jgi:hypothetical protein
MYRTICFTAIVVSFFAFGQESTPRPADGAPAGEATSAPGAEAAPVAALPKWYERIKLEGLAEGYYSYRFQGATTDKINELRAFDNLNNTFTPSWGKVAISMAAAPVGFRLDLAFGPVADIGGPDLGTAPYPGFVNLAAEVYKHILQGYASAKFFDRLTVDFGKFYTSAGAEIFENSGNWLTSRSMIFTYGPYTHAGLRMSLPINDVFTVQASIVNGWDNIVTAISPKMYNVSAFLNLSSGTSIAFNFYGGPQNTANPRLLFDLVAAQTVGAFGINLNGIYGMEASNKWYAGSLMAKYTIADRFRIAARVEYFGDPDGFRTAQAGSSYLNSTLGFGYIVTNPDAFGTVELRPEFRHDQQLSGGTAAAPGVFVGGTSASQTTAQFTMVAWF